MSWRRQEFWEQAKEFWDEEKLTSSQQGTHGGSSLPWRICEGQREKGLTTDGTRFTEKEVRLR